MLSSTMTTSTPRPAPATNASQASLQLHKIDHPDDENIANVLALSNAVFDFNGTTKHGLISYWRDCLSHPSSFILYLAPDAEPTRPVAFLFVIWRIYDSPLKNGDAEGQHVWLAGVSPEWRQHGCLARMMHELNYINRLTICTHPIYYPQMWKWLTGRGWIQEREFPDGKVMFYRPEQI
ncbi:hypothetical protein GY45DRAFT_601570 [Cubamyces sp. BRFM 1775]|nr:hypothetical protein GY45DRAFT_601570 [Cubamyces sp. BRFM 1775]